MFERWRRAPRDAVEREAFTRDQPRVPDNDVLRPISAWRNLSRTAGAMKATKRNIAVGVAVVLVIAALAVIALVHDRQSTDGAGSASAEFFDEYVDADGRVVRRDQGGDTVSEGQAYAMQLAVDDGDAERFEAVWRWAQQNLQRGDGLFSWRWLDGEIVDSDPASDADFDIANALSRAGRDFERTDYSAEAQRIATAVLDEESVLVADGRVLVAGTWAVADRIVNPSYLAPCDYEQFAASTGDQRWLELRDGSMDLLGRLIAAGLPPDWLIVGDGGQPTPIAAPDHRDEPGRYGLDAARVPARLAECAAGRELLTELAPRLESLEDSGAALAYSLDGARLDAGVHPLGLIAGALTAAAGGDEDRASELMERADDLQDDHSTYYGSAWIALAEDILERRDSDH